MKDSVRQQDPKALASHYTWKKQLLEAVCTLAFAVLSVVMVARLAHAVGVTSFAWAFAVMFPVGMVVSDLVTGLVHWFADTWGTVEVPILGPSLIKNFREHHAAPKALTKKGLVETNGDSCMALLPLQAISFALPLGSGRPAWLAVHALIFSFSFWVVVSNQIHKWAHMTPEELALPVRLLQRAGIILPIGHHDVHHSVPFESHYCITNGWLNVPLVRLGFFRGMERLIWRLTGAIPRENDIGTEAAVAIAIRQGVLPPGFVPGRSVPKRTGTRDTPTSNSDR